MKMLSTVSRTCSGSVKVSFGGTKASKFLAGSKNVLNNNCTNGKTNYTTTSGLKCLIVGRSLTMEDFDTRAATMMGNQVRHISHTYRSEFGKDRPEAKIVDKKEKKWREEKREEVKEIFFSTHYIMNTVICGLWLVAFYYNIVQPLGGPY